MYAFYVLNELNIMDSLTINSYYDLKLFNVKKKAYLNGILFLKHI